MSESPNVAEILTKGLFDIQANLTANLLIFEKFPSLVTQESVTKMLKDMIYMTDKTAERAGFIDKAIHPDNVPR